MNGVSVAALLFQLGQSVAVAVVTAVLTVGLALKRFYRERWWEAKMQAYVDVVNALHQMKRYLDELLEADQRGIEGSIAKDEALTVAYREAWSTILRRVDTGQFWFSAPVNELLQSFVRQFESRDSAESFALFHDAKRTAVAECLSRIVPLARRDLKLPAL